VDESSLLFAETINETALVDGRAVILDETV
jgi:hypothetical protein